MRNFIHRLGQKVIGTDFQFADTVRGIGELRHNDHRQMYQAGSGLHGLAHFEAVHISHQDIKQHDLREFRFDDF